MKKNALLTAFVAVEALFYAFFMFADLTGRFVGISSKIKYASILLCCCFEVFVTLWKLAAHGLMLHDPDPDQAGQDQNRHDSDSIPADPDRFHLLTAVLTGAALIFTAVSDWFLLFSVNILPGLITFCIVQTLYFTVIRGRFPKRLLIGLAARVILTVSAYCIISETMNVSGIIIFPALFYAVSFVANIINLMIVCSSHYVLKHPDRQCMNALPRLFLLGMILFLLCDINVLIFNLGGFVSPLPDAYMSLRDVSSVLMWAFYLPSQVIIVCGAVIPVLFPSRLQQNPVKKAGNKTR